MAGPVPSGVWNADALGENTEPGKGPAAVRSEEIFGHAVNRWAVPYLGGGGTLGGQQRTIAAFGFAPLMVGPGGRAADSLSEDRAVGFQNGSTAACG
jgi:hypothetical protein